MSGMSTPAKVAAGVAIAAGLLYIGCKLGYCNKCGSCKSQPSLYKLLGGEAAIDAVVDAFYVKVLSDPKVSFTFKNTNMTKQRDHQKKFLTMALGGPTKYNGRDMRSCHATINNGGPPTEEQFGAIAGHLASTLGDFGVAKNLIDQVLAVVATTHDDILCLDSGSLYEQLGGEAAIDAVVDAFYVKVLADPKVSFTFKNTNMKKQRDHQKKFLTMALGGPMKYNGRDMRTVHATCNNGGPPTEEQFGAIAGHLIATLKDFSVEQALIDKVIAVVATTHDDVLCIKQGSLYEQLGGEAAIDAVVVAFYVKVLADPKVSFTFKNTNMTKQRDHQKKFLTMALGGPNKYNGRQMRAVHAKCNNGGPPTEEQFGAIAGHLTTTLQDFSIEQALIDKVIAVVATTHDDVLCIKAA